MAGPGVMRPSPDSATLKLAFTKADHRTQRKSDGTIVVEGCRFEVPNRYRHFTRIEIRYPMHLRDGGTAPERPLKPAKMADFASRTCTQLVHEHFFSGFLSG